MAGYLGSSDGQYIPVALRHDKASPGTFALENSIGSSCRAMVNELKGALESKLLLQDSPGFVDAVLDTYALVLLRSRDLCPYSVAMWSDVGECPTHIYTQLVVFCQNLAHLVAAGSRTLWEDKPPYTFISGTVLTHLAMAETVSDYGCHCCDS